MTVCQIKPMWIGDSPEFLIEMFKPDGVTPYPLAGHTIIMTAKRSRADLDAAAVFQLSTTASTITIQTGLGDEHKAIGIPPSSATSGLTSDVQVFVGVRIIKPTGLPLTVFEGTMSLVRPTTLATS